MLKYTRGGVQNTPERRCYLQLVDSYPRIVRKLVQHRHQEHETGGPVANQGHHADQVEYPDENVGHVGKLV